MKQSSQRGRFGRPRYDGAAVVVRQMFRGGSVLLLFLLAAAQKAKIYDNVIEEAGQSVVCASPGGEPVLST